MPSCALMYLRTASGSSLVDGVAYSAIGMLPSVVMTSARTARSSGMPATANPVAIGGWGGAAAPAAARCRGHPRGALISWGRWRGAPRFLVPASVSTPLVAALLPPHTHLLL